MLLETPRRRSAATLTALLAVASLVLAGCGSSTKEANGGAGSGPCGTKDKTTLTVGLFGSFGFEENGLWDAYNKRCPNITIKEDVVEQSADYWTRLKTRLASGSGLSDVQAIEIGFVADVVQNHADDFVNWNKVPNAAKVKSEFFDWKWQQASSTDGKTTVGLGTDIGPEAICYRKDLLDKAGVTSDPEKLKTEWATWDDFIDYGKQYEASPTKQAGSHFVDSSASIFSTAVYQGDNAYANDDGEADVEGSDGVEDGLGLRDVRGAGEHHRRAPAVLAHVEQGVLQRRVRGPRLPDLDDGVHPGPGRGSVRRQVGVAPVLPGGATNWGGSWLGVPSKAKNQAAGHRARRVAVGPEPAGHDVGLEEAGRALPVQLPGGSRPFGQGRHQRLLQQRPRRQIFGDIASR